MNPASGVCDARTRRILNLDAGMEGTTREWEDDSGEPPKHDIEFRANWFRRVLGTSGRI